MASWARLFRTRTFGPRATRSSPAPGNAHRHVLVRHVGAWARGSPSPAPEPRSCFPSTSTHLWACSSSAYMTLRFVRSPKMAYYIPGSLVAGTMWSMAIKLPTVPPHSPTQAFSRLVPILCQSLLQRVPHSCLSFLLICLPA